MRDIDETTMREIINVLEGIREDYTAIMKTLLTDTSIKNRTVGVGYVSHEQALDLSMVGPFARASAVNYDVRMFGRGAYGELADFQPILDSDGDCYARVKALRYIVRALEERLGIG